MGVLYSGLFVIEEKHRQSLNLYEGSLNTVLVVVFCITKLDNKAFGLLTKV